MMQLKKEGFRTYFSFLNIVWYEEKHLEGYWKLLAAVIAISLLPNHHYSSGGGFLFVGFI